MSKVSQGARYLGLTAIVGGAITGISGALALVAAPALSVAVAAGATLYYGLAAVGIGTGITLQLVNGKAFIHLLILMTSFGTVFGDHFVGKMIVVALNVGIKLIGWGAWGIFGSSLRKQFDDSQSSVLINRLFGISLFCVAVWILIGQV